jgi:hypothetical protein
MDWTKITDSKEVIDLLKQREKIEEKIRGLDNMALIYYELESL